MNSRQIMLTALSHRTVIPAFNVPYLPMIKPIVSAVRDERSFAFVAVARLEWVKFESVSMDAVKQEYDRWVDSAHTRLHLDHMPVVDEDGIRVDYRTEISHALELGYDSVMVDGSRMALEENIRATAEVAALAARFDVPVEGELGAVVGHEDGPMPPYEELFASKRGFTTVEDATVFAEKSGCDWLSAAIGNVHGQIAKHLQLEKKIEARLDLDHLSAVAHAANLPIVLHGGSGIPGHYILEGVRRGIAKINIGMELRQAYISASAGGNIEAAQDAVYEVTRSIIRDRLQTSGNASLFA
ncbi:MAG TPA: class II fructose-bisphosphate aldolase [Spirochaetia bacterium]|nr:class II fructose-bisphosphate aldolase [Spirochaetia bacterium]